jgi:hypothetical protein
MKKVNTSLIGYKRLLAKSLKGFKTQFMNMIHQEALLRNHGSGNAPR